MHFGPEALISSKRRKEAEFASSVNFLFESHSLESFLWGWLSSVSPVDVGGGCGGVFTHQQLSLAVTLKVLRVE